MSDSLKSKTLKGAMWAGLERVANQAVGFVISLVLSRLLAPSDYGTVGILCVFLGISGMFIDCGLGTALIRKKDRTEDDFSTVFWCNLCMSVVCYAALFFSAPAIAAFYHMPVLAPMVRVLGLTLVIGALTNIQTARLTAVINFRSQARVSILCCISTGAVGIFLAWRGAGAWALVGQSLFSAILSCVLYWSITKWHPKFRFSKQAFRELFGFGSKILAASCLHTIYLHVSPLIIGRKYSAADLGFYSRGDSLAALPGGIFQGTLGRVIFPVLASIQDDEPRLRPAYNKYLRLITSLVAPSMLLLAAVSEPLIGMLIGEKWLPCVPYLRLLALAWMIDPIILVNLNILYVKGRSDLVLRLEIVKKIIAITIVVTAVQFGVLWLCVGRLVYAYIALYLNLHVCGPFIGMSFWRQVREVAPAYAAATISAFLAYCVTVLLPPVFAQASAFIVYSTTLAVACSLGAGFYLLAAWLLRFDLIPEGLAILNKVRGRFCKA